VQGGVEASAKRDSARSKPGARTGIGVSWERFLLDLALGGTSRRVGHAYKGKLMLGFCNIGVAPRSRTSSSSKLLLPPPCAASDLLLLSISSTPSIPCSASRVSSIPYSSSTIPCRQTRSSILCRWMRSSIPCSKQLLIQLSTEGENRALIVLLLTEQHCLLNSVKVL
jgi:hypothetical protein